MDESMWLFQDSACKDAEEEEEENHTESGEEEEDLEAATEAEQRRRLQQAEFEKDKVSILFYDFCRFGCFAS